MADKQNSGDKIRQAVLKKIRETLEEAGITDLHITSLPAVEMEVDSLSSVDRIARTASPEKRQTGSDNFWDLGKPKEKVYQKPDFSKSSLSVTDIKGESSGEEHTNKQSTGGEKILPKEEFEAKHGSGDSGRVIRTVNGYRAVTTSDYRRRSSASRTAAHRTSFAGEKRVNPPEDKPVQTYRPDGILIDQICVRHWESEVEFYGRFITDARQSHQATSLHAPDVPISIEPYFSYVPQYSHLTARQVESYRWIRENIRMGRTPPCELPYILLYIYEIINLPDLIPPERGVEQLCTIWLGYRKTLPRLDSLLAEWLADYCMIHAQPMPRKLIPILREIVPKAQFKEFYLNLDEATVSEIGTILMEVSSDYDFRLSRYYAPHKEAYEAHIPAAVSTVIRKQFADKRSIFVFDRLYKMTRDSYSGAIVSSGIKRRIDLEFRSFTRRADFREQMTALVKYAENRLRQVVGVKAKLGTGTLSPEDMAVIDGYFAPLLPEKKKKQNTEDAYMPADYLKNYESEDSGFDLSAALAIEQESWVNTSRLTGEDLGIDAPIEYEPDIPPAVEGEMTLHEECCPSPPQEMSEEAPDEPTDKPDDAGNPMNDTLKEGLRAALEGSFRTFCREKGFYEGELADRINTVFLEELGDVVLEENGGGFVLIEDYREDVEQWL